MAITIDGTGTIGGITAGGLPNGIITKDDLAAGAAGAILQVVQTEITSQYSVTSTATEAELTGFTLDITPSSASSKVLIMGTVQIGGGSAFAGQYISLERNTQKIFVGTSTSNRNAATIVIEEQVGVYGPEINHFSYLDSPNSTSTVTYRLIHADKSGGAGNALYVNLGSNSSDSVSYSRTSSSLIAMEVGA